MSLLSGLGYDVTIKVDGTEKTISKGNEIKLNPREMPCKRGINGRAVCHILFEDSPALPPEVEKTFHLVTSPVATYFTNRNDLLTLQFKGAQRNAVQANRYDSYPGLVSIIHLLEDPDENISPIDEETTSYEIVNTLAFPVTFEDGEQIPAEKLNCMLVGDEISMDPIDEIPVTGITYTKATNLPEPKPNTLYIVSKLVADAIKDRFDLISPNTFFSPLGPNNTPKYATGFVAPAHNKRFD